ncbi:MAG: POTRA domain-containing protein [Verrucomicrobiota bacterium]
MHSQPGTELKSSQIDADIRTLYESGLVDDVRFLAKPDGLAVRLIAEVTLRHSFGPSVFVGNTLFSDQRLAKETLLKLGTTLTHEELRTACREIETFYHNNGYPNAKATVTSFKGGKPTPDDFIFRIEEGAQAGR